jgi:hypothetical protein
MDATLKSMGADRQIGASGYRSFLNAARVNDNYRSEIQALGRRHRITGNTIERVNKTTAKFCYLSEGVIFTATIFNDRGTSNIELRLNWLVAPFMRILGGCQFCDELIKGCVPVADARAIAEHRIE